MDTRARFVFLMHPKEFKQEKAGTGRLTHLCLANSEIQMGIEFDSQPAVQALLHDPHNYPVLLYPGPSSLNLSDNALPAHTLGDRRLVIFLLDATWACAKKMLRVSPSLQRLPRIMFTPTAKSRFVIKQQPNDQCLSTLEATHETLLALAHSGLDQYTHPAQLLALFQRMQDYQLACAADPARPGYRRRAYSTPSSRTPSHTRTGSGRNEFFQDSPP